MRRRVLAAGVLAGAATVALALAALPAGCADRWAGLRAAVAQDTWNATGFGLVALLFFGFLFYDLIGLTAWKLGRDRTLRQVHLAAGVEGGPNDPPIPLRRKLLIVHPWCLGISGAALFLIIRRGAACGGA